MMAYFSRDYLRLQLRQATKGKPLEIPEAVSLQAGYPFCHHTNSVKPLTVK